MHKQINNKPYFFIPVSVLLLFAFACCLLLPKQTSFLFLNNYHTFWLDAFFTRFTNFGDGLVSVATVILLAGFNKRKEALAILCAYISSGLTAQLIKHLFDQPRPRLYFEQSKFVYNHFINGSVIYSGGSFPSGHSASAFAMATVFALMYDNKWVSIVAFIMAALVGYSRIYLAQHFLQDVTAGAFTGVFFGMLSYFVIWQKARLALNENTLSKTDIYSYLN